MNVFISWSGQTSKEIAEIFRQWIPSVIQMAKPYFSPDDISKGVRWNSEISQELNKSKIGIICLTKDNLNSPWIMFEAGALSKNIENTKVCPILFDIEPTDIQGPLIQFQAAKFNKEEIKKVMKMINLELGDISMKSNVFEKVFEMWWPNLEEDIDKTLIRSSAFSDNISRSEKDMLKEILTLARNINVSIVNPNLMTNVANFGTVDDLIYNWNEIISSLLQDDYEKLIDSLEHISEPIEYIINNFGLTPSVTQTNQISFNNAKKELNLLRDKLNILKNGYH